MLATSRTIVLSLLTIGLLLLVSGALVACSGGDLLTSRQDDNAALIQAMQDLQRQYDLEHERLTAIETQAQVDMIREDSDRYVEAQTANTDAYIRRLLAETNVDLSTADMRTKASWRNWFQVLSVLAICSALGGISFGWASNICIPYHDLYTCPECNDIWRSLDKHPCPTCRYADVIHLEPLSHA